MKTAKNTDKTSKGFKIFKKHVTDEPVKILFDSSTPDIEARKDHYTKMGFTVTNL